MGRKRKFPAVAFLRTFNEREKLTEEEKQWLLRNSNRRKKRNGFAKR